MVVASLLNSWKPKPDVQFAKPSGHTALFYAVAQPNDSSGSTTTLKALLKRGADPNVALKQPDSLGWTPLHFGMYSARSSASARVPCEWRRRIMNSFSLSMPACKFENVKHAQLLLDYGKEPVRRYLDVCGQ